MIETITVSQVQDALKLQNFDVLSAHHQMLPLGRVVDRPAALSGAPRIGSVMLLLYCHKEQLQLALTKRQDDLNAHGGQISFPGGRLESQESLRDAALRETYEEIGVDAQQITMLGRMSKVYVPPSDFEVHPFVGWVYSGKRPFFIPQPSEVAQIIDAPLRLLLKPETRKSDRREFQGNWYDVPYFDVNGHKVWGATAVMLNEFIERIRFILQQNK